MKSVLLVLVAAFSLSAAAESPQQLLAEVTPLFNQFNSQYNSGNKSGACFTGGQILIKCRALIDAIRASGQANTPQGQHAIQNITDQMTNISGICQE